MRGRLIMTRYSVGKDLVALKVDQTSGEVVPSPPKDQYLIQLASDFLQGPLDVIENQANGDLYVSELGIGSVITLLRPSS